MPKERISPVLAKIKDSKPNYAAFKNNPDKPDLEILGKYPLLSEILPDDMAKIQESVHPKSYEVWFKPLRFLGKEDKTLIILAPDKAVKDQLKEFYLARLTKLFGLIKIVSCSELKAKETVNA